MRREGYEFAVSKAEVLYHTDERGKKLEPMERAFIDVPDEFSGSVIEKLSNRKGELQGMGSIGGGYTRLLLSPARLLLMVCLTPRIVVLSLWDPARRFTVVWSLDKMVKQRILS